MNATNRSNTHLDRGQGSEDKATVPHALSGPSRAANTPAHPATNLAQTTVAATTGSDRQNTEQPTLGPGDSAVSTSTVPKPYASRAVHGRIAPEYTRNGRPPTRETAPTPSRPAGPPASHTSMGPAPQNRVGPSNLRPSQGLPAALPQQAVPYPLPPAADDVQGVQRSETATMPERRAAEEPAALAASQPGLDEEKHTPPTDSAPRRRSQRLIEKRGAVPSLPALLLLSSRILDSGYSPNNFEDAVARGILRLADFGHARFNVTQAAHKVRYEMAYRKAAQKAAELAKLMKKHRKALDRKKARA